jgi:hypothetical protein
MDIDMDIMDIDSKRGVILVLLDLSAAFDTIDHMLLVTLLKERLGLTDLALSWITSFLSNRSQSIVINGEESKSVPLSFGVPQGSVLGPFLYTIYTLPLGDILHECGINYHMYADDSQLYLSFDVRNQDDFSQTLLRMQNCVTTVKNWMTAHKLKLNDDKTEVLYLTSPYYTDLFSQQEFKIGEISIVPTSAARNIGILFDCTLSMTQQINSICRVAHFHLRNLGAIRKFITQDACEKLIHAFISSRLDYGNSLLSGVPDYQIYRLQRILHIAARIATLAPPSIDIDLILGKLHWLRVEQRIKYKILLLTFRAVNGIAPPYISELLVPYDPARELRSSELEHLTVPTTNLKTFGDRAFAAVAPKLWNELPLHIRQIKKLEPFKSAIKTRLFQECYGDI